MHNFVKEHDYKKMIRFMKKSFQSFCNESLQITKPFIDNVDFLIVNFPYFEDIEMVSKYFLTQNEEFNVIFISKFYLFCNIIFYDPSLESSSDVYDKVSLNKIKLWENVLGRSGREKLKKSWVRVKTLPDSKEHDTEIFVLNSKTLVISLFFKIVNYHFRILKNTILDHINIKKILEYLYIDDTLIDRILDIKHPNLFKDVKNPSKYFIEMEKFSLLEKHYKNEHEVENDVLDTKRLVYLFLIKPNYLDYKTIYNILDMKAAHICIYEDLILEKGNYLQDGELVCPQTKYYLYISLLKHNSPAIMSKYPLVVNKIIDLFFLNEENTFLSYNIDLFFKKNNLVPVILDKLRLTFKHNLGESFKSNPKVSSLFSFCKKLLKKDNLENIKYSETQKINEYIDRCYDESFMRYICKLVIDEVPILNIFEKKDY